MWHEITVTMHERLRIFNDWLWEEKQNMKIESIKIHNYKVFKDVEVKDISNMAVFLGKNGVGKTTFFDVFGFLHDCLNSNVISALSNRC